MTNIWAFTEGNRKITSRSNEAVPILTIYDPELTLSMPLKFAAASAMNALAQAVVNVATDKPNPIVSSMAIQAISSISEGLPLIIKNPKNIDAHAKLLYGSLMAGASFGGSFNTPHAETHAILLSHSVAFNANATSEGTRQVARAMNVDNASEGIFNLLNSLKIPNSLKDIGVQQSDLDKAVDISLEKPINNPESVDKRKLKKLLENAYIGASPQQI
jgi:maleylacetate reductase